MPKKAQPAPWLNGRRIRAHGLLLAVCLWSVYAVVMATPGLRDRNGLIKGTDFLHFYTIGTLALRGEGQLLYDMRAQSALVAKLIPQAAGTVYVPLYGPQVSLFFCPFAKLSYAWALVAWLLLNVGLYGLCVYVVWKTCPNLQRFRWTVVIAAMAFPGLFHLLTWGQSSGLALLCFTLAFLALHKNKWFLAGLAIGMLIFKPQLGLAAAVIFVASGEARIVLGALLAAGAQLAVAWAHYGTAVMRSYVYATLHVGDVLALLEPRLYRMHSLRAFWLLLLPWPRLDFVLYLLCSVAILVIAVRCWKAHLPLGLRYSAMLLATVLVSPHLTAYDLVILAPAFLLFADWAIGNPGTRFASAVPWLLYACYLLFLLGPLARYTHLQLSVPAMVALLWMTNAATLSSHDHTIATQYQAG